MTYEEFRDSLIENLKKLAPEPNYAQRYRDLDREVQEFHRMLRNIPEIPQGFTVSEKGREIRVIFDYVRKTLTGVGCAPTTIVQGVEHLARRAKDAEAKLARIEALINETSNTTAS